MSNAFFEKYKDPRWQKKRLEVLDSAEWVCQSCYGDSETLHVHHKKYFKNRDPWDYDLDQLMSLCETCHKEQHSDVDLFDNAASRLPIDGPCNKDFWGYMLAGSLGLDIELSTPFAEEAYNLGASADLIFAKMLRNRLEKDNAA